MPIAGCGGRRAACCVEMKRTWDDYYKAAAQRRDEIGADVLEIYMRHREARQARWRGAAALVMLTLLFAYYVVLIR
jgi:hypothetical protein